MDRHFTMICSFADVVVVNAETLGPLIPCMYSDNLIMHLAAMLL